MTGTNKTITNMPDNLHAFDFSLQELAIAGGQTVGIVGMNELTAPLIRYCRDLGYKITGVFDGNNPGNNNLDGVPVLPLQDIRTLKPDAVVLATFTSRKKIKSEISKLRGPVYKGLVIIADGADNDEFYNERFEPIPEIERLHNLHKGQPAIIIGNGPSLLKTDPRTIKNAITFGCNSIFLLDGFTPTYYFVEDVLVAEDRAAIINKLPWTKLFPNDLRNFLANGIFFNVNRVQWINYFSEDFALGIEMNATVTYTMLHAAFYFGCNPVYLIGVDHNYIVNNSDIDRNNTVFTSKTDDQNHFHPDYFGKGLRWHDPRVDRMEAAYRLAHRAYEAAGRRILNATAGGRLEVFERVSFDTIVNKGNAHVPVSKLHPKTHKEGDTMTTPVKQSVVEMKTLWDGLNKKSDKGYISHLQQNAKWDDQELHLTGIRFVDRMMERFSDYGTVEPSCARVLEIGCGIGRFLKVLAARFKEAHGVDISEEMLSSAKEYCLRMPNIRLLQTDGNSLKEIADNSFEYCVSAGVFQHITHIEVILNYIREAIRILKPGGIFLFQFEANRTSAEGSGQNGARITAEALDKGLKDTTYAIREISMDPADPVRNMVIVLQKQSVPDASRSFKNFKVVERRWISGVYDDIRTKTQMHERLKQPPKRVTFYDTAEQTQPGLNVASRGHGGSHIELTPARESALVARLVRAQFLNIKTAYPKIILYGAGAHTRWLMDWLAQAGIYPDKMSKIMAIMDNRAGKAGTMYGLQVIQPSAKAFKDVDAIVLSTDCHQDVMRTQLATILGNAQIPVIDLYEGLPGPFHKCSVSTGTPSLAPNI